MMVRSKRWPQGRGVSFGAPGPFLSQEKSTKFSRIRRSILHKDTIQHNNDVFGQGHER